MKKRGQVSFFILAGVIILLGVAIFGSIKIIGYYKEKRVTESDIVKVKDYIKVCIEKTAKEALTLIGQNAGYINPEDFGVIANDAEPTEGNGVRFAPGSNQIVAYWWYMNSNNDCSKCSFSSMMPSLDLIKGEIESYINTETYNCLADFKTFKEKNLQIRELGLIDSNVRLADKVLIDVNYPISIKKLNVENATETRIDSFHVELNLNFPKIYETAQLITAVEADRSFLERHMLNLMSVFTGLSQRNLPPYREIVLDPGSYIIWPTQKIYDYLKIILSSYIPGLQVRGSENYEIVEASGAYKDVKQRVLNNMILDFGDVKFPYEFNFFYFDWWPFYLSLNDASGIIEPSSLSIDVPVIGSFLQTLGIKEYRAVYDISWPVIVRILDKKAFKGEGYSFFFALEGNIRNNDVLSINNSEVLQMPAVERSLTCDRRTWNTGNNTIYVEDSYTGEPIADALVRFKCGDDICTVGKTNASGSLVSKLPICVNGQIIVSKQDYLQRIYTTTTEVDRGKIYSILMKKFKDLDVELCKIPIRKSVVKQGLVYRSFWIPFKDAKEAIGNNEQANIFLKKQSIPSEQDYSTTIINNKIRLVPETYEVTYILIDNNKVHIPEHSCNAAAELLTFGTCEIPSVDLDVVVSTYSFNVTFGNEIYKKNKITFCLPEFDLHSVPEEYRNINDLKIMGNLTSVIEPLYKRYFKPELE